MDKQELKNLGLKATAARLKIGNLLQSAPDKHWDAEAIYQQLSQQAEDVSLATVYRVLTQFYEAGLLERHQFAGGNFVFEWAQKAHHDHLVCVKCEGVEEFVDETIEQRQHWVAKQHGFQMTDHSLIIYGVCQQCLA